METKEEHEEFALRGEEVVGFVKRLVQEGSARRVSIKDRDGNVLADFPLTYGVAGALLAPSLAGLGAIAALLGECTIAIVR